jgi:hypothetical protein
MRAILKRVHSPDIDDLSSFQPEDEKNFSFLIQLMVGPDDGEGEESFDVEVCTPHWIEHTCDDDDIIVGKNKLIVLKYDYKKIEEKIHDLLRTCTGETWEEVAFKVSRIGKWEFEDYRDE